jgi:hypothetical protein
MLLDKSDGRHGNADPGQCGGNEGRTVVGLEPPIRPQLNELVAVAVAGDDGGGFAVRLSSRVMGSSAKSSMMSKSMASAVIQHLAGAIELAMNEGLTNTDSPKHDDRLEYRLAIRRPTTPSRTIALSNSDSARNATSYECP